MNSFFIYGKKNSIFFQVRALSILFATVRTVTRGLRAWGRVGRRVDLPVMACWLRSCMCDQFHLCHLHSRWPHLPPCCVMMAFQMATPASMLRDAFSVVVVHFLWIIYAVPLSPAIEVTSLLTEMRCSRLNRTATSTFVLIRKKAFSAGRYSPWPRGECEERTPGWFSGHSAPFGCFPYFISAGRNPSIAHIYLSKD